MLAPFMFNQYVIFIATAALVILISFTGMDSAFRWNFRGLLNFRKALNDPALGMVAVNTVVFTVCTMLIKMAWGFVIALTTTLYMRSQRAGVFFRMIWLLPRISPTVVEAMLWTWVFSSSEYGVLNSVMHLLYGWEPVPWLTQYPLLLNILLAGIMGSSFTMVVLSSAIQSINKSYFYVAKVDGASEMAIIKDLVIPFLKWPLTFLVIWQGLSMLTSYETILLLTDGGPMYRSETWALHAFHKAFSTLDFGYGSAISVLLLPVIAVVVVFSYRMFGFNKLMGGGK